MSFLEDCHQHDFCLFKKNSRVDPQIYWASTLPLAGEHSLLWLYHLWNLFVRPKTQGMTSGFARRIFSSSVEWYKTHGAFDIYIYILYVAWFQFIINKIWQVWNKLAHYWRVTTTFSCRGLCFGYCQAFTLSLWRSKMTCSCQDEKSCLPFQQFVQLSEKIRKHTFSRACLQYFVVRTIL